MDGGVFWLLLLYLNEFTERDWKPWKRDFPLRKKTLLVPHRFWCSEGRGGIDLTRPEWIAGTVPAVRPSAATFIHIFPFRLHLHGFWVKLAQCDKHRDPADSRQPPHLEANCWDGKQQASFPADENTNMNCYYYFPISCLSTQSWIFSHPSPVGCQ